MVGKRQLLAVWGLVAGLAAVVLIQALLPRQGGAQGPSLAARVGALEAKLACVSASSSATDVFFEGCNVHIRNGLAGTATTNSLGNLIVGYNEDRPSPFDPADRSGSHNLVVGPQHEYRSYGGLVAGFFNTISGPYTSVSGGFGNTASGEVASVSGGNGNKATADGASVSGGFGNTASGEVASVSGGHDNTASGSGASVSGGANRGAPGNFDWAAGGLFQDF